MNKITNGAELEAKMKKRLDELCKCAQTSGDERMFSFMLGYRYVYNSTKKARFANERVEKDMRKHIIKEYHINNPGESLDRHSQITIQAFRDGMEEAMLSMGFRFKKEAKAA